MAVRGPQPQRGPGPRCPVCGFPAWGIASPLLPPRYLEPRPVFVGYHAAPGPAVAPTSAAALATLPPPLGRGIAWPYPPAGRGKIPLLTSRRGAQDLRRKAP